MMRTTSILSLVLAALAALAAAAPASANDGYRSTDSVLAGEATQTTGSGDPDAAKALFSGATGDAPGSEVAGGDYRSADALVAARRVAQAANAGADGGPYLDALIRTPATSQAPPVRAVETGVGAGFDWGDALIGAAISSAMLLAMLAAVRSVTRHRRASTESQV